MNRINIFWDLISRSLPKVKQHANDRIPTVEEIKKLIEYPDRRIKRIVLLSAMEELNAIADAISYSCICWYYGSVNQE